MAENATDVEPIDYTIGSMDITEQTSTFNIFIKLAKWVALGIAGLLVFLNVWFAAGQGFIAGFISGAVVIVAGYFLLRAKNESDRPH